MRQDRTVTLAVGERKTIFVTATLIIIKSATAAFKLQLQGEGMVDAETGSEFGAAPNGRIFRALNFLNTSAGVNTVEYIVADEPVKLATRVASVTANVVSSNSIANCVAATQLQITNTALVAAGATPFAAVQTFFRRAIVHGRKSLNGATNENTDIIYIGSSGAANEQPIPINPGSTYVIQAQSGEKFNFQDWYFKTTSNGDGIVAEYT